jgi:hypothetical protein
MKLSDHNNKTLMLTLHQEIEKCADYIANRLDRGETSDLLNYPPNCGLTAEEENALKKLENDESLKSALRKILADNSASVLFEFFNNLDGTTDPDPEIGDWTEVALVDKVEDIEPSDEMLHDYFYSTYWDWKVIRPETDWKLDTHEE